MARPIGYSPEEVLLNAMHLFWEKGYEATSIKDVVEVTGLKPGSLYNLYGNKEGIFEAVVNQYATESLKHIQIVLSQDNDAIKNIESFLKDTILKTIANTSTNGCLLVKTLLVLPHKDEKLQKHIVYFFDEVEKLLSQTLEKAKEQGTTTVDAKHFSRFIITTIFGLHAYHKSHNDMSVLEKNIDFVLGCLKRA